jgi:hypothetical protein
VQIDVSSVKGKRNQKYESGARPERRAFERGTTGYGYNFSSYVCNEAGKDVCV